MNFTADIKKEIISRGIGKGADGLAEKRAGFSAFVRTSGELLVVDGVPTFRLISERENVAEFFTAAFSEIFLAELSIINATLDRKSGRDKLILQCPLSVSIEALTGLALLRKNGEFRESVSATLTSTEKRKISYIRGAFLGSGSCTIPSETGKAGYHLEIIFPLRKTARDFCDLLCEFEIIAKMTKRKDTHVVYIKSKEQISDFLAVIGAKKALKRLSELVEQRDKSNHENRAQNCMAGNADKAAIAAVKQVKAIQKLIDRGVIANQNEELQALAKMRVENPSKSLQELADMLKVSKSCLNHRMRRLMTLAQTAEETNEENTKDTKE